MEKIESRGLLHRSKRFWIIFVSVLVTIAIALGIGLGVGLTRGSDSDSDSGSGSEPSTPTSSPLPPTNGSYWKPTTGTTWQIELLYALNDTSANVSVYDIDLFNNPATTIDTLHSQGRRVICYFSAGSYEDKRPDSQKFTSKDKGKELDGWPGEYWLNTSSPNVREIMRSRIALAKTKGCDGVDPDNIDGYSNENGLDLTSEGAIDFLTFLAAEAHGRGLAIGLKNGGALVNTVLGIMEWEVNEQCSQYEECDKFRPFVEANKPVFHIEYPGEKDAGAEKVTSQSVCGDAEAKGFSTVLKRLNLDDWLETC